MPAMLGAGAQSAKAMGLFGIQWSEGVIARSAMELDTYAYLMTTANIGRDSFGSNRRRVAKSGNDEWQ